MVLKWGLPAPTFLCRKSVWFQSQVFKDERKLSLGEEMELFALKAFLLILVSATVPRSLVPTRESSFHPEKVNTVFPNKPWTIAQTSDFKAFLRLQSPKLKGVMEKDRKLQASGGEVGGTQKASHSPTSPSAGDSPVIAPNRLLPHSAFPQLIPSPLRASSSPFLGPRQNSCAFQLFSFDMPSNSKIAKCFTNYAFENVHVFFCIELTLFLKTMCLGNSLDWW